MQTQVWCLISFFFSSLREVQRGENQFVKHGGVLWAAVDAVHQGSLKWSACQKGSRWKWVVFAVVTKSSCSYCLLSSNEISQRCICLDVIPVTGIKAKMIVSPAPKAVGVFVLLFFTLNACIHHFYSFKWAGVTDTPTAGGSKLPSLQATSSNEWNWEGDNLMREREKLSKGGGTRRNGRGFAARTRGRERGGTQRMRLQRDRKTERVGKRWP